jgi:glucose/arabinose dehydrogenase
LISLRTGTLIYIEDVQKPIIQRVSGLPTVWSQGQGGLLDILLAPNFATSGLIYFSAAVGTQKNGTEGPGGTGLYSAEFKLSPPRLNQVRQVWNMAKSSNSTIHFGGRLAIGSLGQVFLAIGDRGEQSRAQDLEDQAGKILVFDADNTGYIRSSPRVYSYGHRNPQGLFWDATIQSLISHEHGPKGGDEINLIQEGFNYGWPLVSYGINYNGSPVSPKQRIPGVQEPLLYWSPSIAPSGLVRYPRNGVFAPNPNSGFSGNFLAGALAGQELRRVTLPLMWHARENLLPLTLKPEPQYKEESLLKNVLGRIRDIRLDQAGYIWLVTDSDRGQLLRISPIKK